MWYLNVMYLGSYYLLLPRFYSDVLRSLVFYPVVFHSHIWMQDVGLGGYKHV